MATPTYSCKCGAAMRFLGNAKRTRNLRGFDLVSNGNLYAFACQDCGYQMTIGADRWAKQNDHDKAKLDKWMAAL